MTRFSFNNTKIAILSGKGGTGKTTLSMNLAALLKNSTLIDTDVEEPNLGLFLKGEFLKEELVLKDYPVIDSKTCTLCGACGDFCNYHALLPAKRSVLVYKELCHACKGCALVCEKNAISFKQRPIGEIIQERILQDQKLYTGRLSIGETSGVKIIETLKEQTKDAPLLLIDSPPGTSCATVAAIKGVDFAILVTEPTPFGLSDMKMVIDMLPNMKLPFGVVINKSGIGDLSLEASSVQSFCREHHIPLLGQIPFKKEYAAIYSRGKLLIEEAPKYKIYLEEILQNLSVELAELTEAS